MSAVQPASYADDHVGRPYWIAGDALGGVITAPALRDLAESELARRTRELGPLHPRTLEQRHLVARRRGLAGDPRAARGDLAGLLPELERLLGADHPDVLTVRHNHAVWTAEAGSFADARDRLRRLHGDRLRVLGPTHPATVNAGLSVVELTAVAGDRSSVVAACQDIAAQLDEMAGRPTEDSLLTRIIAADWGHLLRDPVAHEDRVRTLAGEVLEELGADHPATLMAGWLVAVAISDVDTARAADVARAVVAASARLAGAEHPWVLARRAAVARWATENGGRDEGRAELTAVAEACERRLGPDHPQTTRTRLRALLTRDIRGADVASGVEDCLRTEQNALGDEHPQTLDTALTAVRILATRGDHSGAIARLHVLVPAATRVTGPRSELTLSARALLGHVTLTSGDIDAARRQLDDVLPDLEALLGREARQTVRVRWDLADIACRSGDLETGVREMRDLVGLERAARPTGQDSLALRLGLAEAIGRGGDEAAASTELQALVDDADQLLGSRHTFVALVRLRAAELLLDRGDRHGALDLLAPIYAVPDEQPSSGAVMFHLKGAVLTARARELTVARQRLAALLPSLRRVYGPQGDITGTAELQLRHWDRQDRLLPRLLRRLGLRRTIRL